MNNWFTVKVKYTKQLENGTFKRVSEPYLLCAMTFTDAETRIYEELGQIIRGEFNVVGISRTEIHDIFHYEECDVWYKCKITFESEGSSVDGEVEKKKKVAQNFLVTANSVKDAFDKLKESLSTLMVDYLIPSIIVSPIVDIFPYREELDKEISRKPIAKQEEKEVETEIPTGNKVYSAPSSDFDEEEVDFDEDEEDEDSELEDGFSDDE
jgi:Domain of unknown function (DUF4494)